MQGQGKREIPEKTRSPTASSGTIPTFENPGLTRPGILVKFEKEHTDGAHDMVKCVNRARYHQIVAALPLFLRVCYWPSVTQGVSGNESPNYKAARNCTQPTSIIPAPFQVAKFPARVAERLVRSPPTKANWVQSPAGLPGFSQLGIVPDDAVGRRVFSGISSFPHPFIPGLLHIRSITLIGFQELAVPTDDSLGQLTAQPIGILPQPAVASQTQGPFPKPEWPIIEWVDPHQRNRLVIILL
ncbi:hypothetical protein PR048_000036 [Dryococelus australis]|uniref:Uncharacterized protein n=1 Tax=Dryococelus australis TaxID=614101 RepID=A0ABQ9IEQ4_9NEOP|nr:hypothetical protein PR048_000036 [Dryococelus australis]